MELCETSFQTKTSSPNAPFRDVAGNPVFTTRGKDVCQIPKKNTICQLSTGCFHRFLAVKGKKKLDVIPTYILLMEEILHHLGCIKPCKKWDNLLINWCRISSINSISFKTLVSKKHPFMPHGSLWNHLQNFLGRTT